MVNQAGPCIVCDSESVEIIAQVPNIPVLCNILWATRDEAKSVHRVDMRLGFCRNCGHIFNPDFDLSLLDYSQEYENSLHFSPRFQQYADRLARDLVERHALVDKTVIEIGSGKGDFLELLCEMGDNRGIGFDPSYVPGETERSKTKQIEFVQDFYSEQYTDLCADFIACRHTLEHIEDPVAFLGMVRRTVGDNDATLFFEVPNGLYTMQEMAIWDIIYEHCSLFTQYSLSYLFERSGFTVTDIRTTFGGQYLCIEAKQKEGASDSVQQDWRRPNEIADEMRLFAQRFQQKTDNEQRLLQSMSDDGMKVVIWGAGSKGITLLNLQDDVDLIKYAVDLNPRKQGMYITGTGQLIVPPDYLTEYDPDAIIVMNPLYVDEIRAMVHELGLDPQFLTA